MKTHSALLQRLEDFRNAYNALNATWQNNESDEVNEALSDKYPFPDSFDEMRVNTWIETAKKNIAKL